MSAREESQDIINGPGVHILLTHHRIHQFKIMADKFTVRKLGMLLVHTMIRFLIKGKYLRLKLAIGLIPLPVAPRRHTCQGDNRRQLVNLSDDWASHHYAFTTRGHNRHESAHPLHLVTLFGVLTSTWLLPMGRGAGPIASQ